jgi:NUDIX domain
VREETGLACALGQELPSTQYTDAKQRLKTVRYWAMENCSGEFRRNDEVDSSEWLSLEDAAARLTYARDLDVLNSLR